MTQSLTLYSSPASGAAAMHIAFGVDRFYVAAMAVTIISIVANNPGKSFIFHVLVSALPPGDVILLETLARQSNVTLRLHQLDRDFFQSIPDRKSPTYAIYYRLFLCALLKGEADHVLYLDSDIVCLRALPPLPELNGAVAAVVPDAEQADRNAALGRDAAAPYFNSGVMYIDIRRWNELDVTRQAIDRLAVGQAFRFPDQDALNLVLAGKTVMLDRMWNRMWEVYQADPALRAATVFLHYAGQKPWLPWSPAFLDPAFAQYLERSPWPLKRLTTPATRKNKGQYARYLFRRGDFCAALLWYARFIATPRKANRARK